MRAAEQKWPEGKTEKRDQYLQRLRRTALSLPSAFIDSSISDMRRRCQRLFDVGGGHFEEGGK